MNMSTQMGAGASKGEGGGRLSTTDTYGIVRTYKMYARWNFENIPKNLSFDIKSKCKRFLIFFELSNLKLRNLATNPLNGPPPPVPPRAGAVDESLAELDGFDDDDVDDVAGGIAAAAAPDDDEDISMAAARAVVAGVVVGA